MPNTNRLWKYEHGRSFGHGLQIFQHDGCTLPSHVIWFRYSHSVHNRSNFLLLYLLGGQVAYLLPSQENRSIRWKNDLEDNIFVQVWSRSSFLWNMSYVFKCTDLASAWLCLRILGFRWIYLLFYIWQNWQWTNDCLHPFCCFCDFHLYHVGCFRSPD